MDNLSKCMIQCKKDGFGCHYGAWRAAQMGVIFIKEDTIPEGWKKCEFCGELFKPAKRSDQKFCGAYCQRRKADILFKQRKKEGAEDGQA